MLQPRQGLVGVRHGHVTGVHVSWWHATASRWCSVTPPSPTVRFMLIQGLNGKNSSRASSAAISTISLSCTSVFRAAVRAEPRPVKAAPALVRAMARSPRDMTPLGGSQDEHGLATLL